MNGTLIAQRPDHFEDFATGRELATARFFVSFERLHELQFIGGIVSFASCRVDLFSFGRFVVGAVGRSFEHAKRALCGNRSLGKGERITNKLQKPAMRPAESEALTGTLKMPDTKRLAFADFRKIHNKSWEYFLRIRP